MHTVSNRGVRRSALIALGLVVAAMVVLGLTGQGLAQDALIPAVAATGTLMLPPPDDAIVLFDGTDLSQWVKQGTDQPPGCKLVDGALEIHGGSITTKQRFTDFQLHIEFNVPLMPDARGQARGNSGVYMQGSYEIQVLDSYGLQPKLGDCGAIYGVALPMVNACKPAEQWQTYDILFHAPRFDEDGNKVANARITALHNGVWIHDNVEVPGPTTAAMRRDVTEPGPIMIQDHGAPLKYRNIWLRPLGPVTE